MLSAAVLRSRAGLGFAEEPIPLPLDKAAGAPAPVPDRSLRRILGRPDHGEP